MGIRWPAHRSPCRHMDAGLRRHDERMAVISNVVTGDVHYIDEGYRIVG